MKFRTIVVATIGVVYTCIANAQTDDLAKNSSPELMIKAQIESTFAKVDTDKNGEISHEEFSAYMEDAIASQVKIFNQTFDALDIDKDGVISRVEADQNKAFAAGFNDVDTNGDGFISKAELAMAMKAAQEQKSEK
jgi:Ca2+-binding EF-hand superfamily protein